MTPFVSFIRIFKGREIMLTLTERIEHDLLGDLAVPAAAYYGVHTLRALENFPITGIPISVYPNLVNALASVKEAAALANYDLGLLSELKMQAIVQACRQVPEDRHLCGHHATGRGDGRAA